ncbi:MAG TPA: thiamine pyrophosphate-dependent enzyme [Opitutus sp.]|nr:thiamine pyrophosphate-dependent enzyme [Opitutus sp.]
MARRIRRHVLAQSFRAGVGHIGCALSVADLIATLYARTLQIDAPESPARDRFILSKGHAALALYAALEERGWLPAPGIAAYLTDGSWLGVHPSHHVRGIEFSTGSLGYGPGFGAGCALAARLAAAPWRTVVLVSDAECAEGSIWETAAFAAEHELGRLTVIVDVNGQQALGATPAALHADALAARWRAHGWRVLDVDGHDCGALEAALANRGEFRGAPGVVLARTVFGRGVSFMERRLEWHYRPMSGDDYERASAEVEAT